MKSRHWSVRLHGWEFTDSKINGIMLTCPNTFKKIIFYERFLPYHSRHWSTVNKLMMITTKQLTLTLRGDGTHLICFKVMVIFSLLLLVLYDFYNNANCNSSHWNVHCTKLTWYQQSQSNLRQSWSSTWILKLVSNSESLSLRALLKYFLCTDYSD